MAPQWEPITRYGKELRAFVGASDVPREGFAAWLDDSVLGRAAPATARDAEGVLQYLDGWAAQGFTHYVDFALAEGWFRRAAELTSEASERALDGATYPQQLAAVTEALQALAWGYRALDLPWCIDPAFRAMVEGSLLGVASQPCERGAWARVFERHAYRNAQGAACVSIWERWHLGADSTVDATHVTAREAHADGTPSDSPWVHHYDQKGGRWVWWKSWAMYHDCAARTGIECDDWRSWALPPPFWWWRWVRDASRSVLSRGLARVVAESLATAMALNLREARRLGVWQRVQDAGSYAGSVARLEGLADVALEVARDVSSHEGMRGFREMMQYLGPVTGVAGGIIFAVAELAAAFAPAAVMRVQDVWRRDLPVFEKSAIRRRDGTWTGVPTHDVPDPPMWDRVSKEELERIEAEKARAAVMFIPLSAPLATKLPEVADKTEKVLLDEGGDVEPKEQAAPLEEPLPPPPKRFRGGLILSTEGASADVAPTRPLAPPAPELRPEVLEDVPSGTLYGAPPAPAATGRVWPWVVGALVVAGAAAAVASTVDD